MSQSKLRHKIIAPDPYEPSPFISQTRASREAPSTIVFDRKFDTALRASHIEVLKERIKNDMLSLDDVLITEFENFEYATFNTDKLVAFYPKLLQKILLEENSNHKYMNIDIHNKLSRVFTLAKKNSQTQCDYLLKNYHIPNKRMVIADMKKMMSDCEQELELIFRLTDMIDWLNAVVNMSNAMYSHQYQNLRKNNQSDYLKECKKLNSMEYKPYNLLINWSHRYCFISFERNYYVLPKAYILMMHNKLADLLSILVFTRYAKFSIFPKNSEQLILRTIIEITEIIIEHGQQGFGIVKDLEALVIAETLLAEETWKNDEFLEQLKKDLRKESGFDYHRSELANILRSTDSPFRNELGCLVKIAGHPFVDMEAGVEAICTATNEVYALNFEKIEESICYMKQSYIRNHIAKESKWPPISPLAEGIHPGIKHAYLNNIDPEGMSLQVKYGKIKITDYRDIELLPNMIFNKLENAIPHLKDKTISILRNRVINHYLTNKKPDDENNGRKTTPLWVETRLLLFYMLNNDDTIDHLKFINNYDSIEEQEDLLNYLVVRIVPKEKEMKVAFRGFGCTTYQNRMLYLAQEKNAMNFLDNYSDEQAMTLGELSLTKRLWTFRNLVKAYSEHVVLYVNIDASKWNNHFRQETCDYPMRETLDKIFNTNIFGKTQQKYRKTLFYIPDTKGTYSYVGQEGGIEGLNQDTWVIQYIAQIKTALSGIDIKYHILCKGDDLRIALIIPKSDPQIQDMLKFKEKIMKKIKMTASDLGHKIKIEESYASERFFCFSKAASIDKVELSQVLRKIPKTYGATNAFLATIEDYVGSTFSNAHSACKVSTNVLPAYMTALFWSYYYLLSETQVEELSSTVSGRTIRHKSRFKKTLYYADLTDNELIGLLLVPGLLGGFPIIYLHNMFLRAESDLFSPFIDIYYMLRETRQYELSNVLEKFMVCTNDKILTWKPLYQDPYALPISKPKTASQFLKSQIAPLLNKSSKAESIRELFDLLNESDVNANCIAVLDSCPEVHGKVFSMLFASFPESIIAEIVAKFENARSVYELLILKSNRRTTNNILRKAVYQDYLLNQWRINRLLGVYPDETKSFHPVINQNKCPAQAADSIREYCWKKPVIGITMPPMAHLLYYVSPLEGSQSSYMTNNHFLITIDQPERWLSKEMSYHFGHGKKEPFMGHKTSPGTLDPQIHIVEKDPILMKLRNIVELASWTSEREGDTQGAVVSNIRPLIEELVKLYTKLPLKVLSPFAGVRKSGSIAHHLRIRQYREAIMPNQLSNVYQFVQGESNSHGKFYNNATNYYINFLQCFCYTVSLVTFELNTSKIFTTPEEVWAVTNPCDFCNREVIEPPIIINTDLIKKIKMPQLQATSMSEHMVSILKKSLNLAEERSFNIAGHERHITIEDATCGVFQWMMTSTLERSRTIADKYSHHPGTLSGNRLLSNFLPQKSHDHLGHREMKGMEIQTLSNNIIDVIISVLFLEYDYEIIIDLESFLSTIPVIHLPWYSIAAKLEETGRLGEVANTMAEIAGIPSVFLNYSASVIAPFMALASISAMESSYIDIYSVIILSNYEMAHIKSLLRYKIKRMLYSMLINRARTEIRNGSMNVDDRLTNAGVGVMVLYTYNYKSEIIIDNFQEGNPTSVLLSHLYVPDHESIEDLMDFDIEESKRRLYHYVMFCSRLYHVNVDSLMTNVSENAYHLASLVVEWTTNVSIRIVETTLSSCVEMVRSNNTIVNDYEPVPLGELILDPITHMFTFPQRDGWYPHSLLMKFPKVFDDPIKISPDIFGLNISDETRYPCNAFKHRVYGTMNNTQNKLLHIYDVLGVTSISDLKDFQRAGIRIACLGDGIGNGASFFASIYQYCFISFTTKAPVNPPYNGPPAAMKTMEDGNIDIKYTHMLRGISDLDSEETYTHLEREYNGHHIYFCDAEPTPGGNIHTLRMKVINYFLKTRFHDSLLIMQISLEYVYEIMTLTEHLSKQCEHVMIIQPPSERCAYRAYIVAQGKSKEYTPLIIMYEYAFSHTLCGAFKRYYEHINSYWASRYRLDCSGLNLTWILNTNNFYNLGSYLSGSILWHSVLQHEILLTLTNDELILMRRNLEIRSTIPEILIGFRKLILIDKIGHFNKSLNTPVDDYHRRGIRWDLNNRRHRVIMIRMMMFCEGWEFLRRSINQKTTFGTKLIRNNYLALCRKLNPRDWNEELYKDTQFNYTTFEIETGFEINYWRSYTRGIETFISFLAWCVSIRKFRNVILTDEIDNENDILDFGPD